MRLETVCPFVSTSSYLQVHRSNRYLSLR
jgi:hypothetical protein